MRTLGTPSPNDLGRATPLRTLMAYGGQFLRLSWLFHTLGAPEIAVTDLNVSNGPGWTGAAAALAELSDGTLENIADEMSTLLGSSYMSWANYSVLDGLKVAAISTAGEYLGGPKLFEYPTTPPQGNDGNVLPQASVVLSLRSSLVTGVGNYGRMYLPHTALPLDTGVPYAGGTATTEVAGDAATFFLNVYGHLAGDITQSVYFPIMSQAAGSPMKSAVTVGVGRVTDTQRRRRNKISEEYAFQAIALP